MSISLIARDLARLPQLRVPLLFVAVAASVIAHSASMSLAQQPTDDAKESSETSEFERLRDGDWRVVVFDRCTGDWNKHWFLDGDLAKVKTDESGMTFSAGPGPGEDASHAVLWTKETFEGDIKIDYEYTRIDDATEYVNIIYLHATGSGEGVYEEDIAQWRHLRTVPTMSIYFNNMNTYHISYAAFRRGSDGLPDEYVRARRYMPEAGNRLQGTALPPDSWDTGLFEPGVPHRITVMKVGDELFMHVRNASEERLFAWPTDPLPNLTEGRVGLRHMCTRISRYRNFRISVK